MILLGSLPRNMDRAHARSTQFSHYHKGALSPTDVIFVSRDCVRQESVQTYPGVAADSNRPGSHSSYRWRIMVVSSRSKSRA